MLKVLHVQASSLENSRNISRTWYWVLIDWGPFILLSISISLRIDLLLYIYLSVKWVESLLSLVWPNWSHIRPEDNSWSVAAAGQSRQGQLAATCQPTRIVETVETASVLKQVFRVVFTLLRPSAGLFQLPTLLLLGRIRLRIVI